MKTILTGSVNDMAIDVGQTPDSQTLSFPNSIATGHSNPTYCGSRIYTLSPTYSFLTIASDVLTLSTSTVADSGTYNPVTLQVSLQDYPSIVLTKTFTATISCNVYSLNWAPTMPTRGSNFSAESNEGYNSSRHYATALHHSVFLDQVASLPTASVRDLWPISVFPFADAFWRYRQLTSQRGSPE